MKYKLLKEMPDIQAGKIGIVKDNSVEFESDYDDFPPTYFPIVFVEEKPDWFTPFCFTTEDGVDIYLGEQCWILNLDYIFQNRVYKKDNVDCSHYKYFSTRQAAEEYLNPKFKVGDIITTSSGNTYKILEVLGTNSEFVRVKYKHSLSDLLVSICRKSTNQEIISYYEKLGWVKGASFKEKGQTHIRTIELVEYDACTNIVWIVGGQYPNKIEECELINYPKSWEDLKSVEGYYLDYFGKVENSKYGILKRCYKTQKQAESALAFAQLSQLVAEMNGDVEINWNDCMKDKYTIERENSFLIRNTRTQRYAPLAFVTKEARDFSFQHHKKLWEQYWQI